MTNGDKTRSRYDATPSAKQYGAKLEQEAPFATPDELPQYDAIIFGTPTRFGNMAGQMRNFLDQTGSLWLKGALVGKVGSVFTSTGTGGGNESTILTFIPTLLHHGMIYVGLPYQLHHPRFQANSSTACAIGARFHRQGNHADNLANKAIAADWHFLS